MANKQTFKVSYTRKVGGVGTINVKASDAKQAIINARNLCAAGKDFRDAVETTETYVKPRKQGFAGRN